MRILAKVIHLHNAEQMNPEQRMSLVCLITWRRFSTPVSYDDGVEVMRLASYLMLDISVEDCILETFN